MRRLVRISVIASMVVLLYDAVASLVSLSAGIDYTWFVIGSAINALLFGFISGREGQWFDAGIVGAVMGLVDSTLGWTISWSLGPGRPDSEMSISEIGFVVIFVTIDTAILAFVGSALSLIKGKNA